MLGALLRGYFWVSVRVRERVWPGVSWRCLCVRASWGGGVSGQCAVGERQFHVDPIFVLFSLK